VIKQYHKKISSKLKVQVFLKFFQMWKNEEKSQKTLMKVRKQNFLENLSLITGKANLEKVGN